MKAKEISLFSRLLKAAKSGECPAPDCAICEEKRAAIREAEKFLMEVKE